MYDKLDQATIKALCGIEALTICVKRETDSTNSDAKRYGVEGGKSPAMFLAETQTAGRGRMGRRFYSPEGTGLYASLLIDAGESIAETVGITAAAAVAARRAVFDTTGVETQIKWVNDLYRNNRKTAGILAESFACHHHCYVIIGIGINLYTEDFPEELENIATSLHAAEGCKNRLAASLAHHLMTLLSQLPDRSFMAEYRACSMVLGKEITYTQNGQEYIGIAESIDDDGALWIRHPDGGTAKLASGEISLRVRNDENRLINEEKQENIKHE